MANSLDVRVIEFDWLSGQESFLYLLNGQSDHEQTEWHPYSQFKCFLISFAPFMGLL